MQPIPQFTAALKFHFNEHTAPDRGREFVFGENLHRRVPMAMEGVDGMNTIGMWNKEPANFNSGDATVVDCVVIAPEIYFHVVQPSVHFTLWDGGFFATGTVLERFESGWPQTDQP
ncbi:MAG: hypothetical protein V4614_14715 [Pseudomonadota bacterium]